jgi:hypothetical protein
MMNYNLLIHKNKIQNNYMNKLDYNMMNNIKKIKN